MTFSLWHCRAESYFIQIYKISHYPTPYLLYFIITRCHTFPRSASHKPHGAMSGNTKKRQ